MGSHILHTLARDPHLPRVLFESSDILLSGTCRHGSSSFPQGRHPWARHQTTLGRTSVCSRRSCALFPGAPARAQKTPQSLSLGFPMSPPYAFTPAIPVCQQPAPACNQDRASGLDHGIGHYMIFEVDLEAQAPAPPMPKWLRTSSAASDRRTVLPLSSRQAG